jgi:hypothetical protein
VDDLKNQLLEEKLGLNEGELQGFNAEDCLIPAAACSGEWTEELIVLMLSGVHAFQGRGVFNLVRISDLCEPTDVFGGVEAIGIRRKWRELLDRGVEAIVKQRSKQMRDTESRERASTFVGQGVRMNRRLRDELDLTAVVHTLERIGKGAESEAKRLERRAKKTGCPVWAAPWSSLLGDEQKVQALLFVAIAVRDSESGFFRLKDAFELAKEAFEEDDAPWARPVFFRDFLLRYLPIVTVEVRDSNQLLETWLCAKPSQSDDYVLQLASLAQGASENSLAVQEKLKTLPVQKYL